MSPTLSVEVRAQQTLRRTAAAATGLLGVAALADRMGGSATPFLLMAAALVPQVLALALALRLPGRIGWLKIDRPTTWFLRALVALALASALVGVASSPLWVTSLAAAAALLIAAWSPVVVANRR